MKRSKLSSRLRLLFVGAVVLPAAFLAFLAVRAINREEAYIEKQLEQTLSAELVHVVGLITAELDRVQEELDRTVPAAAAADPRASFPRWKQATSLVRTPFLLSPEFEILWPRLTASASEDEVSFLNGNREFVTDKTKIPVYQNIALAYQEEIASLSQPAKKEKDKTDTGKEQVQAAPAGRSLPLVLADRKSEEKVSGEETSVAAPHPAEPPAGTLQAQKALKEFEESESIRQQVYQQARERGQQPLIRNVAPSASQVRQDSAERPESIFISEPKKFSEIIAGRDSGLIARFLGENLHLFYWKKGQDGEIVGCVIEEDALRGRLADRLPAVYSASRVLTVLDEDGRPLLMPPEDRPRDWRRPFVSREVSELLPRWEAAAYLADPGLIRSRAHLTAVVLWALVLTFLLSILAGGTLVLRTLRNEMDLARKKTTFVTNVSHELKTPLTSIRMFAEMLREGRQPDPRRQEQYLGLMVSETDRLTRLINNVLDFSRLEKGQKQYTLKFLEAGRLVRELVEGQRLRLEHGGFRVRMISEAEPLFIKADEEAVKQALLNLLSNAEKYSESLKEIEVEVSSDGRSVLIRVKDRGIGVPAQQAKKIFQEFYRADDSLTARTKGTGLGLPIARRIVQDHGGDILYAPREGGGSVFEIRLPRSQPS